MTMKYRKYLDYAIELLEKLVNIPSPSGFTKDAMAFMKAEAEKMGYQAWTERTGCLIVDVPGAETENLKPETGNRRSETDSGKAETEQRKSEPDSRKLETDSGCSLGGGDVLCVAAHVDTLGAMVSAVKENGCLKFSSVGGYTMQSIEGEYCKIHARSAGRVFTGTVLTTEPSVHVFDDARTLERAEKNMEIRLDEKVFSAADVRALGIENGDYISFEPRFEHTASGFIKSRHLDDKASAAVLWSVLKYMADQAVRPAVPLKMMLTGFEEIGHGASWLPEGVTKMLAVDMGAVGADLCGNEYRVSICAKDSSGPYDFDMTSDLIALAKRHSLAYAVDIFPHYGSDVSAALKGGNPVAGALIGQGVHASHGMERTHEEGIYNTMMLLMAYTGLL